MVTFIPMLSIRHFGGVDHEMMCQSRDNSVYMVVSPRYGTWEAIFKDMDFKFHECDMSVADATACEHMFAKCVTQNDEEYFAGGKKVKKSAFHTTRNYTDTQKAELDKRFLHSIQELAGKKVLIVGAGTIGNLLVEYAINSGVSDITIVDMDAYEYWNLPRSSMVNETSLRRPKALELAKAAAERSCFSINVTGINANICDLGWGFFEQFDLVLSPVDSAAVRQYIDRGCKLYHIPHITCGTGNIGDQFTGNVVSFLLTRLCTLSMSGEMATVRLWKNEEAVVIFLMKRRHRLWDFRLRLLVLPWILH